MKSMRKNVQNLQVKRLKSKECADSFSERKNMHLGAGAFDILRRIEPAVEDRLEMTGDVIRHPNL